MISVERLDQANADVLACAASTSIRSRTVARRAWVVLVIEVVAFARLHLRTTNPTAAALYDRLGFRRHHADPYCTHLIDLEPMACRW